MGLTREKMLVVYNADGGMVNMLMDGLHKLISPATYPCSLCALTWGPVSMRKDWREFLKQKAQQVRFYHKDDFARDFPGAKIALPAILLLGIGQAEPRLLVGSEELNGTAGLPELIELVEARLNSQAASA